MKKSSPLEFLDAAQKNQEISDRVLAAVEKGGMVTADAVMKIAQEHGFEFSREEFERDVIQSISDRFSAGEDHLGRIINATDPPESSCAKGCVSWTVNWHPSRVSK